MNGEDIGACNLPGGVSEERGIKTCTLSFSYNDKGQYLLAVRDGDGDFKNYLIEVK